MHVHTALDVVHSLIQQGVVVPIVHPPALPAGASEHGEEDAHGASEHGEEDEEGREHPLYRGCGETPMKVRYVL